jgi:DNA-binding MarR family transcriptional regulator
VSAAGKPSPRPRRLATAHADADDSPGLLLWQLTNRWQAAQRAALKPFGLTHVQYVLLASLAWLDADAPVSQKALADHAVTDPMMTSQVVRALADRELLERSPHPDDARAWALSISVAGSRLADRATRAVEQCDAEFFGALGTRLPRFVRDLRALRDASGRKA